MQRKPLSSRLRQIVHVLVLVAGWALFAGSWWRVLTTQTWSYPALVWLLVGALVAFPLLTLAWMRHNIEIYQRKGPRLRVRTADERYERDWEGSAITAEWPRLRAAREIKIELEAGQKRYLRS